MSRSRAPWLLAVLGERPPRAGLKLLCVVAYVSVLHGLVGYLLLFGDHCDQKAILG